VRRQCLLEGVGFKGLCQVALRASKAGGMLPVLSRELNNDGLCRRAVYTPRGHHGFKVRGSRWRKGLSSELIPSTGVVYAVEPILHYFPPLYPPSRQKVEVKCTCGRKKAFEIYYLGIASI
jgi:hypothetical protein